MNNLQKQILAELEIAFKRDVENSTVYAILSRAQRLNKIYINDNSCMLASLRSLNARK